MEQGACCVLDLSLRGVTRATRHAAAEPTIDTPDQPRRCADQSQSKCKRAAELTAVTKCKTNSSCFVPTLSCDRMVRSDRLRRHCILSRLRISSAALHSMSSLINPSLPQQINSSWTWETTERDAEQRERESGRFEGHQARTEIDSTFLASRRLMFCTVSACAPQISFSASARSRRIATFFALSASFALDPITFDSGRPPRHAAQQAQQPAQPQLISQSRSAKRSNFQWRRRRRMRLAAQPEALSEGSMDPGDRRRNRADAHMRRHVERHARLVVRCTQRRKTFSSVGSAASRGDQTRAQTRGCD